MSPFDVVWVLAVMMFAALVQSIGGIGFALLAVPLSAIAVDMTTAVVAVSIGSLFNVTILALRTRRRIARGLALRFNAPALLGLPIGIVVLATTDPRALKIGLGAIIIVATVSLMRGAASVTPRKWIDVAAGWLSGVLATATGTNGPPLVLASQMRRLQPEVFRATMSFSFAVQGALSLLFFFLAGLVDRGGVLLAVAATPLILGGQHVGLGLQTRVTGAGFQRLVYWLLILSGLSVGLSGLFGA